MTASHDALDIRRAPPSAPAALTADRDYTFGELAARAMSSAPTRAIIAEPSLATIAAIHRALARAEPLALLHAKLPPAEQQRQRAVAEAAALTPDDAFVLFTSGSTGVARGVVLSRAAILANAAASAAHLGWRDDDAWLLALSCAHSGGLSVVTRCLIARRPIVLADTTDPSAAARATLLSLVPTQLAQLLADPSWRAPSSWRAVLLGGAAAPPALLAAAHARGVPIRTTYGLTETFGQVATAAAAAPDAPLRLLPGVDLRAGTPTAPARIHIRGPMLASRYLDDGGATTVAIAPELATADLGSVDTNGALHIAGRADDVIITGGENVHPAAVEAVVAATPGVRAVLAFAVADERWGQLVAVAIAVAEVESFDLSRAAAHWRTALPVHAWPRRAAIVAALPELATGKLDRRAAATLPSAPVAY